MTVIHHAYIGLGSNLGDRQQILCQAVARLAQLGAVRVSRLYASPPMGPQDQPDYLNAALSLQTELEALALLDALQQIEADLGRIRGRRWGERTLDLDLLLYDQQQINLPRLIVPHPGLMQRDFVLLPLLDLDAELQVQQQSLKTLPSVQQATAQAISDIDWYQHTQECQ